MASILPQALLMKVVAMPVFPERPVRPIRCTARKGTACGSLPEGQALLLSSPPIPHLCTIVLNFFRHVIVDDVLDGRKVQAFRGHIRGH